MSSRKSYRGYIASRPINGERTAQHIQNLVIRNYAERLGLPLRLSTPEYAMPGCYMMLEALLDELSDLRGLIFYSIHMLPQRRARRRAVLERIVAAGAELHAAQEMMCVRDHTDVGRLDDFFSVTELMSDAMDPRVLASSGG